MSYNIGSFNCQHLGRSADIKKNLSLFARIIMDEELDIVALQEIHGAMAMKLLLNALQREGNPARYNWKGKADEEVFEYGFIWNEKRLKKVGPKTEDQDTEVNVKRVYEPRIYKQYRLDRRTGQMEFRHNPFFARFEPCHASSPKVEFRLINAHIRFSKGSGNPSVMDADENSLGAIAMRKNEYAVLTKAIFPKAADKRYGNNAPAYTILLGDYNLNLKSSGAGSPYAEEEVFIEDGKGSKMLLTRQNKLTTLKKYYEEDDSDETGKSRFANNYDHFTFDQKMSDIVSVDIINALNKTDFDTYQEKVSDHLPIKICIDLKHR